MNKVLDVYEELNIGRKQFEKSVWDRVQSFINELSKEYTIEKHEIKGACVSQKENSETKVEQQTNPLEFGSLVTIADYLTKNKEGVEKIITYVGDSNTFGSAYQKNLDILSEEIQDLINKCLKSSKKSDRDIMIDSFVSKFLSILKGNLFETICENLYRYSLSNGKDDDFIAFKEVIDQFMINAGFEKQRVVCGDKINTKICGSSEHPVPTDDSALHKTIKEIVWEPYVLPYYSLNEGKIVKKIIKGKVVCYSSKLLS